MQYIFFAALLTSVLDQTDKIRLYITDAAKYGVRVLRPDINESDVFFSVSDGHIRYGLLAIRNVGRTFADAVIRERQNGLFCSMDDFVDRMAVAADINSRTLEYLIKSGVFDSLGTPRSALAAAYEAVLSSAQERTRNNISGQKDLFSLATEKTPGGYVYPDIPEFSARELLMYEKESSGTYFSGHLLDDYSESVEAAHADRTSDILSDFADGAENPVYRERSRVRLCGIVTGLKSKQIKGGRRMATFRIDDTYGELEVLVFPKIYDATADKLAEEAAVLVTGTLSEEEGDTPKVILSALTPLAVNGDPRKPSGRAEKQSAPEKPKSCRVYIKIPDMQDARIARIGRLSVFHPGETEVVLFDMSKRLYIRMKDILIAPTEDVLRKLGDIFGGENVVYQ